MLLTAVTTKGDIMIKKLTDEQVKEVCRRYIDGESSPQLGKAFNVTAYSIRCLLERCGIPRRSPREAHLKYSLDETVFDTITEKSAYWVGFLMADGAILNRQTGSPEIALDLSARDKEHIERFRSFLQSSHPIAISSKKIKSGEYLIARFSVRSSRLVNALAMFGVVPRKSLRTRVIGLENNRHFWRGVVDGDGDLTQHRNHRKRSPGFRLVGSQVLLQQFADFLQPYMPDKDIMVRPHKNIYEVRLFGLSAIQAMNLLYQSCSIALERKKAIANKIVSFPLLCHPR